MSKRHIHRMWIPAEENDGLVVVNGALRLGQHALFARLDELGNPPGQKVLLEHAQDEAIAVVARLETIDWRFSVVAPKRPDVGVVVKAAS